MTQEQGQNVDYDIDLFDHNQSHTMWDSLAEMREKCPVAHLPNDLFYASRYADVQQVFRDFTAFSTKGGFRAPGVEIPEEELLMSEMDPPDHPPLRKALLQAFNKATARSAESFARAFVDTRLDGVESFGHGDLVREIAIPLPIAVTSHVLGVNSDDIPQLAEWVFAVLHTDWPAYGVADHTKPNERKGVVGSAPEMCAFLDQLIAERIKEDRQDLLSEMVRVEMDGKRLSPGRVRTLSLNFITGGISTTMLLGNLMYRLLSEGEFFDQLNEKRELIPVAVEESLRLEPPVMFMFRTAKEGTELSGVPIKPGDRVVAGISSANRDETVYPDSATFSLGREKPPEHLAFGAGTHLCLGNNMARMEAAVALETILDRFALGELSLAPDFKYELMPHFLEYGPEHLEVVVARSR